MNNKKIGIITIYDIDNYGNRLQNYALQEVLKKYDFDVYTLKNHKLLNHRKKLFVNFLKMIKRETYLFWNCNKRRRKKFKMFNKNIKFYKKYITVISKNIDSKFNYFIVGSDQVWKPTKMRLSYVDLLKFTSSNKKISYAASIGVDKVESKYENIFSEGLADFKAVSVRENSGKKILEKVTHRKDIQVLVDPTLLLSANEWDLVSARPKQLDKLKTKKYIFNYFLGNLSEKRKLEIERIAQENNCEIINILDKNDLFYETGPAEFIYLEKNAFLICTDSFHSSAFAVLYNKPFIVFDREQEGMNDMNTRIDSFIENLSLKNRKFSNSITNKNINHDYNEAYKILEVEKQKSIAFLKNALEIE